MRTTAHSASAHRLCWLPLVPVVLVLMACGASSTLASLPTAVATATPTTPPRPAATLDLVSATQTFTDSVHDGGTKEPCANGDPLIQNDCGVPVTATCPNGEWAVSGGYSHSRSSDTYITSSYPSSSGTWTVTAHDEGNSVTGSSITVTAIANCLKANFATTTRIITSADTVPADGNRYAVSATCPSGTVLTGGGYRASIGAESSMPSGNAWSARVMESPGASAGPKVYAVCAAAHVQPATVASASKTFAVTERPTLLQACPDGTTLVGGGFEQSSLVMAIFANQSTIDGSGWQLLISGEQAVVPGSATITIYALCATFA